VTNIYKILQKVLLCILLLVFVFSETKLAAQVSSEQQSQLNQYASLVNDYKKQKKYRMVGYYLYKSGSVYLKAGQHQNAIDKFMESAQFYEQIGSYSNKKKIYSNIAFVYAEMGQLKNSKKFYNSGLEISRRLNNRNDISASLMEVATIEIYSQDYSSAQTNLEEALKIANSLNDALLLRTCYRLLAQLYKAYGNKKKSDQYYNNFLIYDKHVKEEGTIKRENIADKAITSVKEEKRILMDEKEAQALLFEIADLKNQSKQDSLNRAITAGEDSLAKVEKEKKGIEMQNQLLEQSKELQDLKIKDEEAKNEQLRLQQIGGIVGIILLLFIIIGAIVAFMQKRRDNKQLEQQKIEIEIKSDQVKNKNDELEVAMDQIQYQSTNIMHSINYAQRIQEAMMPKQKLMQTHLEDSFIFFKPRDVVSGDFYWFMDTKLKRNGAKNQKTPVGVNVNSNSTDANNKFIVSAVDCTGHGVPGAFMSMLGHNLLNDIVGKGVLESDKILGQLHQGIRTSLNQDATQNRDGMDMALCVIDPESKTLEYAGAQNPLIYIQDEKIFRVRGNKFPVGGFQVEHHNYTKHTIKIDKPTTCYIYTDGFHDQFGGPQGRKFMTKNFRDLLFEIHKMPLEEQKNILELVINEWMGENEQTDDILVIGFKLDFSDQGKSFEPADDNIVGTELQTEIKKPKKESLAVEELQTEIEKPVEEILMVEKLQTEKVNLTDKEEQKENIETVEKDIPVIEEKSTNKKQVKNAEALKELLFGDNKKVEKKLSVKEVKKENKNSIKEEQLIKERLKEKEDLAVKEVQKENKEKPEDDIPVKKEQTTAKGQVKNVEAVQGLLFGDNKKAEKELTLKEVKKENKNLIKEEESVKELSKEKKELTVGQVIKKDKKKEEGDIPGKEEQKTNKKRVKKAGVIQRLLFGDRRKEKNKLTKNVKKENKSSIKEEQAVKELKPEKEDLSDKNLQKENEKIEENDIKLKKIDKRYLEHVVVDKKVKEEDIKIKAVEKELTEKPNNEIIEPENDIFKIKKIKSNKRKGAEAVVDIKELQKENKKEEPIKKPVEKTKISSNKIIKIKKL